MKVSIPYHIDASWEKIAKVLCHEEYNVEVDKFRDGVISTSFELIEKTDQKTHFKIHAVEYKRRRTGSIDRSARVKTYTESIWDEGRRTLTWDYYGDGGGRFKLGGVWRLTPDGEKTKMTHDVTIEVDIPILGRGIARMIAREIEKPSPRHKRAMDKYLQKV